MLSAQERALAREKVLYAGVLRDIAEQHPAFIVHAGDFKSGVARCSDEIFLDRRALFDASTVPLIYVPGDNEWTDCSRLLAGQFDPLERLGKLREIFFDTARSLGTNSDRLSASRTFIPNTSAGRWVRCCSSRSTFPVAIIITGAATTPARSFWRAIRSPSIG
jgi:hypothetical protein